MKNMRPYLVFFSLFMCLTAMAQSSLIIYSTEGKKFNLMVNGIQEVEEFQSNISLHNLQPSRYALVLTMEETGQKVEKNVFLEDYKEYKMEVRDKSKSGFSKGMRQVNAFLEQKEAEGEAPPEYVLRLVSQRDLASGPSSTAIQSNSNTTTSSQTTNSQVNTQGGGEGQTESVSISMNVSEGGTTQSTNATINVNSSVSSSVTTTETQTTQTTQIEDEGCIEAMAPGSFSQAKNSISSKTFDDSKVQLAKQVARANCLSADQVKQIMMLFTYEDDRLDFAKYAYPFTFDKGNYYLVNDAFEFELTIDELNEWLERN